MSIENTWLVTCGVCCIFPALMFAAGYWLAKNGNRIEIKAPWKKDRQ